LQNGFGPGAPVGGGRARRTQASGHDRSRAEMPLVLQHNKTDERGSAEHNSARMEDEHDEATSNEWPPVLGEERGGRALGASEWRTEIQSAACSREQPIDIEVVERNQPSQPQQGRGRKGKRGRRTQARLQEGAKCQTIHSRRTRRTRADQSEQTMRWWGSQPQTVAKANSASRYRKRREEWSRVQ
jgi:hypothetical protein